MKDKEFVIIGLVVGVVALAVIVGFIGQGNVRQVDIYWPEKVKQTVAFRDIDDEVQLVGISGTGDTNNPTLIMRTSFAYVLTVVNEGKTYHRLYIDGFNVQTELLESGQNDTIILYPSKEGTFNYYDKKQNLKFLGQMKAYEVVPSDGFTGFFKDLI